MKIYNNKNIIEFIDSLSKTDDKNISNKWDFFIKSLYPELNINLKSPKPPTKLPEPTLDIKNLITSLKDSFECTGALTEEAQQLLQYADTIDQDRYCYNVEMDKYNIEKEEYDNFCKKQEELRASSSKYLKGYAGWDIILDYYPKSTHLKYIIEGISSIIKKYILFSEQDEPIYIRNFKKILPEMVESYLLFGKSTLNFSSIVKDEIVIEDPTQIVNTNMLLFSYSGDFSNQKYVSFNENIEDFYIKYRHLGWKDWDPINYVDALRLPLIQNKFNLKTSEDIKNNYFKYFDDPYLSYRYDLQWTIPVVGVKTIVREKQLLLGGDASLLSDNLYYFGTLELLQSVLKTLIPLINTWHFKDPSVGMSSLYENNDSHENEKLQESLKEAAKEGKVAVITTSTNGEFRVNSIPLDHIPSFYFDLIRSLYSKYGIDVPEQVTSLKDAKKSNLKINYLISNVLEPTFKKYLNVLEKRGRIKREEVDYWNNKGVFGEYPRIDLRDKNDFTGYLAIINSLNSIKDLNVTKASIQNIFKDFTGLSVNFEDIEETQ